MNTNNYEDIGGRQAIIKLKITQWIIHNMRTSIYHMHPAECYKERKFAVHSVIYFKVLFLLDKTKMHQN